jgi:hypothetical protein
VADHTPSDTSIRPPRPSCWRPEPGKNHDPGSDPRATTPCPIKEPFPTATAVFTGRVPLSDEGCEFCLRDWLTWIPFLGLGLRDPVPDANYHLDLTRALTEAGAIARLFELLEPGAPCCVSSCRGDWAMRPSSRRRSSETPTREAGDQGGADPEDWHQRPAALW